MAEKTILVVGDSLSAAYGMNQEQGWVALLQQQLQQAAKDYVVVNASVSGDTTSNGLERLPASLKKYHPVITIIALGGNDGLRGLSLSVIKQNLNAMIVAAKQADSKVLLIGVRLPQNYGPVYTDAFQQIFPDIAADHHVSLVPVMLKNIDDDRSLFQADGIHPKAEAQKTIMSNIWPVLRPML